MTMSAVHKFGNHNHDLHPHANVGGGAAAPFGFLSGAQIAHRSAGLDKTNEN